MTNYYVGELLVTAEGKKDFGVYARDTEAEMLETYHKKCGANVNNSGNAYAMVFVLDINGNMPHNNVYLHPVDDVAAPEYFILELCINEAGANVNGVYTRDDKKSALKLYFQKCGADVDDAKLQNAIVLCMDKNGMIVKEEVFQNPTAPVEPAEEE